MADILTRELSSAIQSAATLGRNSFIPVIFGLMCLSGAEPKTGIRWISVMQQP